MDINELFRQLEEELKRGNYTREQKMAIIKDVGDMYQNEIDNELKKELAKQYAGTALEIGSAALPVGGLSGQIAKKVVPAAITRTMGRKISQDVATSAIGGAIDSAVFGAGRGLMDNENPFQTAAQDALSGAIIGGTLGGVTGKINKSIDANNIRKFDDYNNLSKSDKKIYRDNINKYYRNYELGTNPNVSGVGTVKLSSDAMKETLKQNPEFGTEVINLSKNLKKSTYKNPETPNHVHKYDITEFHRVGNDNTDYLIATNSKGDKYFHKAVTPDLIAGPKPAGQELPVNSINHYLPNNNLPERVNPGATVGIQSAIDNFTKNDINIPQQNTNNENFGIQKPFDLRIEKQKMPNGEIIDIETPTGYATPVNGFCQRNKDLTGYKNPLNGDNRIYTAEDIGDMSHKEFGSLEKIIDAQINSIGIPRRRDLSVFGGGTIYIQPYTRRDGMKIGGHYRALRY